MREGLREVAESGVRGALRSSMRAARLRILENIAGEVLENAVRQAVSDAAIMAVMQVALPVVITPILVPWMQSVAAEHGTLPEVNAALGPMAITHGTDTSTPVATTPPAPGVTP
jgi:hypothetical protein